MPMTSTRYAQASEQSRTPRLTSQTKRLHSSPSTLRLEGGQAIFEYLLIFAIMAPLLLFAGPFLTQVRNDTQGSIRGGIDRIAGMKVDSRPGHKESEKVSTNMTVEQRERLIQAMRDAGMSEEEIEKMLKKIDKKLAKSQSDDDDEKKLRKILEEAGLGDAADELGL